MVLCAAEIEKEIWSVLALREDGNRYDAAIGDAIADSADLVGLECVAGRIETLNYALDRVGAGFSLVLLASPKVGVNRLDTMVEELTLASPEFARAVTALIDRIQHVLQCACEYCDLQQQAINRTLGRRASYEVRVEEISSRIGEAPESVFRTLGLSIENIGRRQDVLGSKRRPISTSASFGP